MREDDLRREVTKFLEQALASRETEWCLSISTATECLVQFVVNGSADVGNRISILVDVPYLRNEKAVEAARGLGFTITEHEDGPIADQDVLITPDRDGIDQLLDQTVQILTSIYGGLHQALGVDFYELGEANLIFAKEPPQVHSVGSRTEIENEDLRNEDFSGRNLFGWSFHRCDLRGVRFDDTVLTDGRITQCDVHGGSFRRAQLQRVRFHGQWFQHGLGPAIAGSEMPGCDFEGADLTGAFMAGVNLKGANFRNAVLIGVDFRGLTSAVPNGFAPKNADLGGANLEGARGDSTTIWPS